MNIRAALLTVFTIVTVVAGLAVASFQLAYPEAGSSGWLIVAAIIVVWAIVCGLVFRVRGQR